MNFTTASTVKWLKLRLCVTLFAAGTLVQCHTIGMFTTYFCELILIESERNEYRKLVASLSNAWSLVREKLDYGKTDIVYPIFFIHIITCITDSACRILQWVNH